ncbi:DUF6879 family protein [Pseudonocardia sp. HH130630-07]|uniref:DUF6879 family protein n=1 Tax=Pseudonocardia sp. HH130630-07 TaxID=1690815 RepID=UPI0008153108|nr:DUF6879 family protein [Pseudonocardia sp. HH130630-07]ANY08064.1 hypothetical protein AFB00_19185 [Pseudonocardia sp. HH130630-07]
MTELLDGADVESAIRGCRRLVFRLETLQVYRGSGEDEWIGAFLGGADRPPPDPAQDGWESMLRSMTAAGVTVQRVHVVVEPLTDYMRFELAWAYPPNARAGEDIRIADGSDGWPPGVPRRDFWILDDQVLDAHYEPDGTWRGVSPNRESSALDDATAVRARALSSAVSLSDFVRQRPDLASRVLRD